MKLSKALGMAIAHGLYRHSAECTARVCETGQSIEISAGEKHIAQVSTTQLIVADGVPAESLEWDVRFFD